MRRGLNFLNELCKAVCIVKRVKSPVILENIDVIVTELFRHALAERACYFFKKLGVGTVVGKRVRVFLNAYVIALLGSVVVHGYLVHDRINPAVGVVQDFVVVVTCNGGVHKRNELADEVIHLGIRRREDRFGVLRVGVCYQRIGVNTADYDNGVDGVVFSCCENGYSA